MKKNDAVRLAEKFRAECPELVNRRVRVSVSAPGYNTWKEVYVVDMQGKSRSIGSVQRGNYAFFPVNTGDVLMERTNGRGLPEYHSRVICPHDEDLAYSNYESRFTLKEKHESVEWAIENLAERDIEEYQRLELISDFIEEQIRYHEEIPF